MAPQEIRDAVAASPELQSMAAAGNFNGVAERLSNGLTRNDPYFITARGVRALDVLPRHRFALLQVLRAAAEQEPEWLRPALTAAAVPVDDHDALADDLASAYHWLMQDAGLDVSTAVARQMLQMIGTAVPLSAPACAAVIALTEASDTVSWQAVKTALEVH